MSVCIRPDGDALISQYAEKHGGLSVAVIKEADEEFNRQLEIYQAHLNQRVKEYSAFLNGTDSECQSEGRARSSGPAVGEQEIQTQPTNRQETANQQETREQASHGDTANSPAPRGTQETSKQGRHQTKGQKTNGNTY